MEQRERDVDERTLQEAPRVDKYVRADFSAIVHDVLKNIWVAVLVGISAAFLAYVWAYVTYHPQYVSQTTFVVSAKGSNTGAYANLSQTQRLAEVFQTVLEVYDPSEERIDVTLSSYLVYIGVNGAFNPSDYYAGADVEGELTIQSTVDTANAGTYYVDYTVTSRTAVGKSRLVVVVR